jgi:hypothetical protein
MFALLKRPILDQIAVGTTRQVSCIRRSALSYFVLIWPGLERRTMVRPR